MLYLIEIIRNIYLAFDPSIFNAPMKFCRMAKNFKIHKINDAEFHFSLMKYPNSIHRNRLKQLPDLKLYTDGSSHNKNLDKLPEICKTQRDYNFAVSK